jgi:hypothetical protein
VVGFDASGFVPAGHRDVSVSLDPPWAEEVLGRGVVGSSGFVHARVLAEGADGHPSEVLVLRLPSDLSSVEAGAPRTDADWVWHLAPVLLPWRDGVPNGEEWPRESATPEQLRRLCRRREGAPVRGRSQTEPDAAMLRRMVVRLRTAGFFCAALAVSSCGGTDDKVGPLLYKVSFAGVPTDGAVARYAACSRMPGASLAGGSLDDRPVEGSVRFRGTSNEQAALAACLSALPQSSVTGPTVPGRL